MSLFNFSKKKDENKTTDNGVLGPTFLEKHTIHIENPVSLKNFEWRRQLSLGDGSNYFKIRYFGEHKAGLKDLIVRNEHIAQIIVAEDIITGKEIILFDGCKHGYNAIFCDKYPEVLVNNRPVTNIYTDKNGNDSFEVFISTYNNFDFDSEFGEDVDEKGKLHIEEGVVIDYEEAKRNGFDYIEINIKPKDGKTTQILSEELA